MTFKHLLTSFALLLMLSLIVAPAAAQAQADNACVILVSDESGSMEENDSDFVRNLGVKLFISLLDDGDRVGVIRFSTSAEILTPELVSLVSPADKLGLLNLLRDEPPNGYTDMLAALRQAAELLKDSGCNASTIVLLSDGAPELEGGLPLSYTKDVKELVRQLNVPIYSIALTAEGESPLLYQLANETAPAGVVIPARSSADLLDAYLEILARLKDRTVAGSGIDSSPGFVQLPLNSALAPYISRATFIIAKPEGLSASLVGPGGKVIETGDFSLVFSATDDPRFAVYIVDNPAPGEWGFDIDGDGQVQARVIFRSRLRVDYRQPAAYHPLSQPMPLAASLIEEELDGTITNLIGQASFTVFIERPDGSQDAIDVLYDDGAHGDKKAGDGVFTNTYVKTDLAGEYRITFTGYKGLIPAARTVRTVVVPFPKPMILSPVETMFEYRGHPLPLEMHLEGGDLPTLDTGAFLAQVTAPDGQLSEVLLSESNDAWSAEFTPVLDGNHLIHFLPIDAKYKGVPYTLSAEREVNIRLVPAISVVNNQLDLGTVEAAELRSGLPIQLNVFSTSPRAEKLGIEIGGHPGLSISDISPSDVTPGKSTMLITIAGDAGPGKYEPTLLLSAREEIDLERRAIPISLKIYQPTLSLPAESLAEIVIRVDHQDKGEELSLKVASTSLKEEALELVWVGLEGIAVESEIKTIPSGETIEAPLFIIGEDLEVGTYHGQLRLRGREGLVIEPQSVEATVVVVPVPWCARWCPPVIGGSIVTAAMAAIGYSYFNSKPRPWGSLTPKRTLPGQALSTMIPIRAGFGSSQVTIGSGRGADIRLLGGKVKAQHAAIKAERRDVTERVGRPPKLVQVNRLVNVVENKGNGLVKVNGVPITKGQKSAPLRNGIDIVLGQYELTYRE